MKKFALIFASLFGVMVASPAAFAGCKVITCGAKDGLNGYVAVDTGGNQCWFCGPGSNSCGNNDVVPYFDASGDVISLYQCTRGVFLNTFEDYRPDRVCDNSDLKAGADMSNTKVTYSLTGRATAPTSLGDWNVFDGSASCKFIKCIDGYAPNSDRKKCIKMNSNCLLNGEPVATGHEVSNTTCTPQKQSTGLESSDHVKSGNVCNIKCVAGGWNVTLVGNSSCQNGYIASGNKKRCIEDPAVQQQRQQQQQQQQANKKQACENSGGTWNGSACVCDATKGLKTNNGVCVCLDENYKPASDGKSCVLTDAAAARRKCEETEGAYWNVNHCACVDRDFIYSGGGCVKNPNIERCKAARGATWDYVANACRCSDTKMDWDDVLAKCVESDEARREREAAEASARLDARRLTSRRNIDAAYGKVLNIRDTFKTSVWKDEDGKFNTARLVSDSVAGVVLGTAGGLITSKVIKKNQIKHGLEDIHCTIGGQTVADYGDQFEAGLR